MKKINWGIIGCGDVTEVKSGPAFNKVKNSSLIAVMRRNADKAKDYAERHQVSKWYSDAEKLMNDPDINAVYIATPPSSHELYTLAALKAGKFVYVEKPMTVNVTSAKKMLQAVQDSDGKLVVAHYRREQPFYKKIKELIDDKRIGDIKFAHLHFYKRNLSKEELLIPKNAWRVNESIAGGGLFYDIAPHQLDMMYHLFGQVENANGFAVNRNILYTAADIISGNILFRNKILFSGTWCFDMGEGNEEDHCEIIGDKGTIHFSFFGKQIITVVKNKKTETIEFDNLPHVQQPMIEKVVGYFLDENSNPCPVEEGVTVIKLLEKFCRCD
ncbi:MAG: Gfo/Idh/MocA family oxidoreductase [Ginsengibacter sp.]